jgi:hypothetical protein
VSHPKWQVIGRGFAGWHAKAVGVTGEGGTLEDRDYPGGRIAGYASEADDGALVYDGQACGDEFVRHVINGPILSLELAPDAYERFSERHALSLVADGLGGGFQALAAKALADETWTGFDRVGVGIFEGLLRRIPGMRLGRVHGGEVTWET